ncbi:hypothetical protein ABEI56_05010 [Peribacillus castrilensis]|uniref:hypothetical protein n=1 Tax=Peribacillus TaxID=2675229 RepID=UPI0038722797
MSRNIDYEQQIYNIEENPSVNGIYLIFILSTIKTCSLDQLALSMYLFRFMNITLSLMENDEKQELLQVLSPSDSKNLDALLTPYLNEKYNDRYKNALKVLLAKNIITVNENLVKLNINLDLANEFNLTEPPFSKVYIKAKFVSNLIKASTVKDINQKINKIIGDIKWKTHFS